VIVQNVTVDAQGCLKTARGKSMDFESTGVLGTEQEAWEGG
jgi:hypothetical protein